LGHWAVRGTRSFGCHYRFGLLAVRAPIDEVRADNEKKKSPTSLVPYARLEVAGALCVCALRLWVRTVVVEGLSFVSHVF